MKKVPIIPPLLIDDHFDHSFANQCSLINNNSKFPLNRAYIMTSLLSSVNIKEDILNIQKSLDVNMTHGHYDISISMLKLSQNPFQNH